MSDTIIQPPAAAPPDPSLTLTKSQLAEHLGVSERSIDAFEADDKIPASLRIGDAKRWSRQTIVDFIAGKENSEA